MQKIVGVRRSDDKNIYYFLNTSDLKIGDKVVANFDEFLTVATVVRLDPKISDDKAVELKKIVRVATDADIKKFEELQSKAKTNLKSIKTKSLELGLMMKFVSAEYSLDNSKIIITFSSEERVDFRQFLKDLASMLKTRIELKQIGQRDEVKVRGGVGPCGEPCCCARFLNEFEHVTVKMAKVQGLSLSPTKINGICGRLMCCLGYESEIYEEVLKRMPKINTEVTTPNGKGVAVYNDILHERVSVKRQAEGDTFVVEDFALEEVGFEGHPATAVKSQSQSNKEEKKESREEKRNESNSEKRDSNSAMKDKKIDAEQKHEHNKNKFNKDKNRENGSHEKEISEDGKKSLTENNHKKNSHFKHKNKNKQNSYNNKNK